MLKLLVKKELGEIFRSYYYDARKNRARSKAATIAYFVLFALLMVGVLGVIFTYLSVSICEPLCAIGADWLYFALMGLIAALLGIFGSVFNTFSALYLPKDNDLLLSLPIPTGVIMASRLLTVYLMGLMYSAVVLLPAVIVYRVSGGTLWGGLTLLLLVSVFILTLSCLLGWVVAKVSQKLRFKSFLTVLISLLFFGGYYFVAFQAQTLINRLIEHAALYGKAIRANAYPVYLFGQVGAGSPRAALLLAAVVLALFGLMWLLLSRSFLRIATAGGSGAKKAYRQKPMRQKHVASALFGRELGRFVSSANYMLNCGLATLLLPVAGVLLLWKGGEVMQTLEAIFEATDGMPAALLCTALCLTAGLNGTAAPSVSLEGRSLWLAQSLPVTPWQILRAKLQLQLFLTLPPLLLCAACMAGLLPTAQLLLLGAQCTAYAFLSALLGLTLGLKLPNLNWTSEPIKNSAPASLAHLIGMLYTALFPLGLYLLPLSWKPYFVCFLALTLGLCGLLYFWLRKKGTHIFATL